MSYNALSQDIGEILEIIKINGNILGTLHGKDASLFKKSSHKNLIIEIYTFWENFSKKIVFSYFENYKKILVDKNFLVNYFQHVQEKSYTRKLFLNSIDENKFNITPENLCYSNNLNFKELKSLFQRIMFNENEFAKHTENHKELETALEDLKNNQIVPIFKDIKTRYEVIEYVEAYLNVLVENRNIVSHQYQLVEVYTLKQFESILNFIKIMSSLVYEYCESQLLIKAIEKEELVCKRIFPLRVYKGNSRGQTAIIAIRNSFHKIITKDTKLYCYDRANKIFRKVEIIKIFKFEKEHYEILPLETSTLEVQTVATINNRNHNFIIYALNPNTETYSYELVV
ncbi:hypothetical protein C162_20381 [Paenibacillus sp. FSL R7-269]|uniref:hypothetical protein n=1 Tax=Paenibacillus sp. FSL R7-269 TaxID=1226755 RepID=UPI0003E2999B|nr:hypothetical protein [Paenibacillus sp. FSL R7-269]ETT45728.1 hypothetical protein C162_20381 [Paenibacillus sp. FSL R7-269]